MGKTIFAAIVAAVLASIATTLIMGAFQAEKQADDVKARDLADTTSKVERDRLIQRITDLEKRAAGAPRSDRRSAESRTEGTAGTALSAGAAGEAPLAPDGTPYVSRGEMETFTKSEAARLAVESMRNGIDPSRVDVKPQERKTVAEIAQDMGLTAGEEASVMEILRQKEEETLRCLFGDQPMDDIKRDALEAKDDPDKQAEMMQAIAQRAFTNVGALATMEKRTKKKIEAVLGKDKAAKFLGYSRKPVIDPEFDKILEDGF